MCDSSMFINQNKLFDLQCYLLDDTVDGCVSVTNTPVTPSICEDAGEEERVYMSEAYTCVPSIKRQVKLVRLVGEGTFSKVFLAKRLQPGTSSCSTHAEEVALKFIKPTISASRIKFEIECLVKLSDKPNVIDVIQCERHNQNVVITMPFITHDKLTDVIDDMTIDDIKEYMRNLLIALESVHNLGIIHRDIKAGNFLYNHRCRQQEMTHDASPMKSEWRQQHYKLVDFGLAEIEKCHESAAAVDKLSEAGNVKLRTAPTLGGIHRKPLSPRQIIPTTNTQSRSKRRRPTLTAQEQEHQCLDDSLFPPPKRLKTYATLRRERQQQHNQSNSSSRRSAVGLITVCHCKAESTREKAQVCKICTDRPQQQAARAGTPGFRAPEVLMKYEHQTTAVDMWSCGVLLLSLLSGHYPFFSGTDDLSALAEVASLLGTTALTHTARHVLGKTVHFHTDFPADGVDIAELCTKMRGPDNAFHPAPHSAYHLLSELLQPNPNTRITAATALKHQWFHS